MVGVRGFEPPTPASRTQYSTRLSYTPNQFFFKYLFLLHPTSFNFSSPWAAIVRRKRYPGNLELLGKRSKLSKSPIDYPSAETG